MGDIISLLLIDDDGGTVVVDFASIVASIVLEFD
jgi:hypothetical protein